MSSHRYLTFIVCLGGAAVLCLEILGTRILGPFYGVSLFLWSALITVTLAALSAGYVLGGRWADRQPTVKHLSRLVGISGLWVLLIPVLKYPVLGAAEPLGLRAAVLVSASVLFFPPLFLLGTIGPYAIRIRTASIDNVGRTAGNLFALSTVASVISALLTGFLLIPNVGVTRLTLLVGTLLTVTALFGFIGPGRHLKKAASFFLFVFPLIAAVDGANPAAGLVAVEQSPYAEIRVIDKDGIRHLVLDGGIHSMVDTATGESFHRYTSVMNFPRNFFAAPGKMLLVGLGGGTLMREYSDAGWDVDAVEIDEAVISVARKYFGIEPHHGTIHAMDGRRFLTTSEETYDVILLDAFGSSSIPFHLITDETFGLARSRLSADGILAINLETVGWHDPVVASVTAGLRNHYARVLALPMAEPPDRLGNLILLASNGALEPLMEPERNSSLDPNWRYGAGYAQVHAWDNRFEPETAGASPFTDDLNASDIRAEAINTIARKELHQYFGEAVESW
jgi:spermidine synthase